MSEAVVHGDRRSSILWMGGIAVLVALTGPLVANAPALAGYLAFIPGLAASVGSVRQTVWVSVIVTITTAASVQTNSSLRTGVIAAVIVCSALFGVAAVYLCRWRIARAEATVRLLSATTAMQRHLLRPLPRRTASVVADGVYEPVQEENLIGGDVYDIADTAFGTRLLVADVQGKGLGALGASFAVVGAFREAAQREQSLSAVVGVLERAVTRQNAFAAEAGEQERFVTALVVEIGDDGEAKIINSGHPLPYLVGPRGVTHPALPEADLPLGLGALAADPRTVGTFTLADDEALLLFTDGVDEGRAPDGTFFPLAKRLEQLRYQSPERLARSLRTELHDFTEGEQHDDITLLTIRRRTSTSIRHRRH